MPKKPKITDRLSLEQLVHFAEIGERVVEVLPGLPELLRRRRRKKKANGEAKVKKAVRVDLANVGSKGPQPL